MANPFDQFDEPQNTQPIQREAVANPFDQFDTPPTETEVLSGEDPLYNDLNKMREQGEFDKAPSAPETKDDILQSKSETYGSIMNKPEYEDVKSLDNALLGVSIKNPITGEPVGEYSTSQVGWNNLTGEVPKELQDLKAKRDTELNQKYENTGHRETLLGYPIRVQDIQETNPDFNPAETPSAENPTMVTNRYLLDAPDADAISRMGYQVLRNIVGGVGDFVTEGKFTGAGKFSRENLPNTVPDEVGEKLATDVTTFIVGPMAITKGPGMIVKGVSGLAETAGIAEKAAKVLSPESQQLIRSTYETTLKATGSAQKALSAANNKTRGLLVGAAFGIQEGMVSPDNSEGIIPPEFIQKTMNVTPETARDISFMVDTPLIGGTLSVFGNMYNLARDNVVDPIIGGARNIKLFGNNVGNAATSVPGIRINEKAAGLSTIMWLDPNLAATTAEDAAFKIKVMGDALERNSRVNLQIGQAGKEIKLDTPAAFTGALEDYYKTAYQSKIDELGPDGFRSWVKEQTTSSANRLYELRTAIQGETEVNSKLSHTASELDKLFSTAADLESGGNLIEAQGRAGEVMAGKQLEDITQANQNLATAERETIAARSTADNAILNDPEFDLFLSEVNSPLGSKKDTFDSIRGKIGDKLYESLKKQRTEVTDAYKAIETTGAEGDVNSFLNIIKEASDVAEDGTVTINNPFLKKIAESVQKDSSFGNINNKIKNDINRKIKSLNGPNGPTDPEMLDTLYRLKDNINNNQINWLISNGDSDVAKLAQDAKDKYTTLRTSFPRDIPEIETLYRAGKTRMEGENMSKGVLPEGQGVANWNINTIRFVQNNLEGATADEFRKSISRAAKAGGQDIDGDIANYYVTKAMVNLSDKVANGKQTVDSLRQSVRGVIEQLQSINSPMVGKYVDLENKIKTLESGATSKEELFKTLKEETANIKSDIDKSIFAKFVYKGVEPLDQGGVDKTLKQIFNAKDSSNQIRELITRAETTLPKDQAEVVKNSIKGTYIDNLRQRLESRRPIGISDVQQGTVETSFKINESNFDKVFRPGSTDFNNMKEIFKDNPEITKQLEDSAKVYMNTTKTTPKARNEVFGPLPKNQNPEFAIGTMINLWFGPLSRTGTRARRLTAPIGTKSLQQVEAANRDTLLAMITDPDEFTRISRKVRNGMVNDQTYAEYKSLLTRATARATAASAEEPSEVQRVPEGVKFKPSDVKDMSNTDGGFYRPFSTDESIDNQDGTYSTERTVTVQDPDTVGWMNVPSLWMDDNNKPVDFKNNEDAVLNTAREWEGLNGQTFTRFNSLEEAEKAAKERSSKGGAINQNR